jgi:hypothetical protein
MGKRTALVLLAATVLIAAACGSSSKPRATPPSLRAVQPYLAKYDYLHLRSLPPSATVRIGRRQAEKIASGKGWGAPRMPGVSATLARVTDTGYCRLVHGKCRLLIRNRAMWIVLVPNQTVPVMGRRTGPISYAATMAVLIDANSGKYINASAIPAT